MDVAQPLEPYIAVFVVFAAPAFVMSTSFCQTGSGAAVSTAVGTSSQGPVSVVYSDNGADDNLTFGTCNVWCEFVLAFRSLAIVVVYTFRLPRKHRAQLVAVRSTLRKLWARCFCRTPALYERLEEGHDDNHEMQTLGQRATNRNTSGSVVTPSADESHLRISETDITVVRRLGQGAFGEVWEARLQPNGHRVAVKMLFAGIDDDFDESLDPNADEDFHRECDALQRVRSPHLITFFGFGVTEGGRGYIVTELMTGGSLEDVLHDSLEDLLWRTRVSIGLQVALGMDHLHQKHMLHRDLKSANVLLDEQHIKAKVCDFGLTRAVRPQRQHVVHSSFTGVTRVLPRVDSVEMPKMQPARACTLAKNCAVTVEDVRGTMTKAAGTLLWMAPEVYRGDQRYGPAVDVYSFGIVLWELATRQTPWDELPPGEAAFFKELNAALQTGRRPSIPDAVLMNHGAFVAVIQQCWAGDPVDRPTFAGVVTRLAACMRECTQ